jgi:DNA-binding transcriptional MerR regulator
MEAPYTKKQVADIVEVSYRAVQFFTEQGVVVPDNMDASGRGRFRLYSNRDLVSLVIARELANFGMTVGEIKKVVGDYNELLPNFLKKMKLYGMENKHRNYDYFDVPQVVPSGKLDMSFKKGRRGIGRGLTIDGGGIFDEGGYGQIIVNLCTNSDGKRMLYGNKRLHREGRGIFDMDDHGNLISPAELDAFWGPDGAPESSIHIPLRNQLRRIQERIG